MACGSLHHRVEAALASHGPRALPHVTGQQDPVDFADDAADAGATAARTARSLDASAERVDDSPRSPSRSDAPASPSTATRSSAEAVTGQLDVTAVSDAQMDERAHAAAEGAVAVDRAPARVG